MSIQSNSGTIKCCDHAPYDCLPMTCQCCRCFASITINVIDMSDYLVNTRKSYSDVTINSNLLHEPITREMLSHEPYTPESADSHSPYPEKIEIDLISLRRNSVSPIQLKKRLESFLLENSRRIHMTRSVSHIVHESADDDSFRKRTMSEVTQPKTSDCNLRSLVRMQSHHSSSEEDWYEFDKKEVTEDKIEQIDFNHVKSDVIKVDKKRRCCCIL